MEYGLIGEKLGHSHSPAIHRMLGDYSYELFPMPPEAVEGFLTKADFRGINVTIPYKRVVIPFCKTLNRYAERTGSVNTIVKGEDGSLHGFNTDYPGFLYMARRAGISFKGEKVLILGNGGTGHTARASTEQRSIGEAQPERGSGFNDRAETPMSHAVFDQGGPAQGPVS
jgi:shikimate dehydrogenase